jgi:ribose 1,5-bisphosphokinase PhnN
VSLFITLEGPSGCGKSTGIVTYSNEPGKRVKYIDNSGTVEEALDKIMSQVGSLFVEEEFCE